MIIATPYEGWIRPNRTAAVGTVIGRSVMKVNVRYIFNLNLATGFNPMIQLNDSTQLATGHKIKKNHQ